MKGTVHEKVLRQVRSLHTLATHAATPEQEAEAARRQLDAMLERYGLRAEDARGEEGYVLEGAGVYHGYPPWASFVVAILRRFYRVEVLECPGDGDVEYRLFGRRPDVVRGVDRWRRLSATYERLWTRTRAESLAFLASLPSNDDQQAYFAGLTVGITEQLRVVGPAADSSFALVPVSDVRERAEAEFQPTPRTTSDLDVRRHPEMLSFGYGDGRRMNLGDALGDGIGGMLPPRAGGEP